MRRMKLSDLKFLEPYFLPGLSGAMLALSFPPFNLHLFAWLSLVPLLTAIADSPPLKALKQGFFTGVIYFGAVMPWIYNVLANYGHMSAWLAFPLLLLLIFYLALYMALFAWAVARAGGTPEGILISPFLFVALEYVRGHFLTGFPWALLAHSQYDNPPVIQIASITGTAGVTFLIVLVNSAVARSILTFRTGGGFRPILPTCAIGIAVLNIVWGNMEINKIKMSGGRDVKVAVIQGNVEQGMKWSPEHKNKIMEKYFQLTREAVKEKPDLVVWPETAVPFFYGTDDAPTLKLARLVRELDVPLIFGGLGLERSATQYRYYNRAYLLKPGEVKGEYYNKMHLVPFGEYVPLRRLLFFVDKITDAVQNDIFPGNQATPLRLNGISAGMQICYEIIFAEPSRELARNGATIIINITNDAWFGNSGASAQHLASLPFRAVENRLPIVRSANTGISGFVTATGEIRNKTGLYETVRISDTLILPPSTNTFYKRFGDLFTFICAAITFIAWIPLSRTRPL